MKKPSVLQTLLVALALFGLAALIAYGDKPEPERLEFHAPEPIEFHGHAPPVTYEAVLYEERFVCLFPAETLLALPSPGLHLDDSTTLIRLE